MFEKCTNCSTRVLVARRDDNGIFCSVVCEEYFRYPGFCKRCEASTNPQSAGSTYTMNGIGTHLYGSKDPCPECGSKIQTKWFVIIFIPVIPISKYRTRWTTPYRYISRKMKSARELEVVTGPTVQSTMGR